MRPKAQSLERGRLQPVKRQSERDSHNQALEISERHRYEFNRE